MQENPYLACIPATAPRPMAVVARSTVLASLGIGAFSLAYSLGTGEPTGWAICAGAVVLSVTVVVLQVRTKRAVFRETLAAADAVITESYDEALLLLARLLRRRSQRVNRAEALGLLARCASYAGDTAAASIIYARAIECLTHRSCAKNLDAIHLKSQFLPSRAFALAVTGNEDEARQILGLPAHPQGHPAAVALRVRATALLAYKKGELARTRALIADNASVIEGFLTVRDRSLFYVLDARARGEGADPFACVDPVIGKWIRGILPELAGAPAHEERIAVEVGA